MCKRGRSNGGCFDDDDDGDGDDGFYLAAMASLFILLPTCNPIITTTAISADNPRQEPIPPSYTEERRPPRRGPSLHYPHHLIITTQTRASKSGLCPISRPLYLAFLPTPLSFTPEGQGPRAKHVRPRAPSLSKGNHDDHVKGIPPSLCYVFPFLLVVE